MPPSGISVRTPVVADGREIDTRNCVSGAGSLPLVISAINAAGITTSDSETLQVDNDPVGLADPTERRDPQRWVNHPVTVDATDRRPVRGRRHELQGRRRRGLHLEGVTVDGDGTHTVTCTAWNNAVDPEGQPKHGTKSLAVHIDESPP